LVVWLLNDTVGLLATILKCVNRKAVGDFSDTGSLHAQVYLKYRGISDRFSALSVETGGTQHAVEWPPS